jgi:mannose-6-phosphate isomerase-like protein (cupin superfamily)
MEMKETKSILITKDSLRRDPNLKIGSRGARKILVTNIYENKEYPCETDVWIPPAGDEKCPVQIMHDTEVAYFNQMASQDRHYHKMGTEMYMVIEGLMTIEVEGKTYHLKSGDMIVVNPQAFHEVKPDGTEFLCRVVTSNCGGSEDKYLKK